MSFLKSCLDVLLKPAEDPRQSASYSYERQRELLQKVRTLLTDIEQSRQHLTEKTADLESNISLLKTRAGQAVQDGREDLARLILQQQQLAILEQQAILAQLAELDQEQQRLLLVKHRLVTQIETYVARHEALAARYSTAESQVNINKALQKVFRDLAELDHIITSAEERTDQMEARASWLDEKFADDLLLDTAVAAVHPYPAISQFDLNDRVEAELAKLKEKIG